MEEQTEWLKSPVSERARRLQPSRELWLKPYHGRQRRVTVRRTEITIGNSESCDIRIDDPFISPKHAELRLERDGEGYFVQDLSSRNGVFLNGIRVRSAPMPSSGTLRLGRSLISWSENDDELNFFGEGLVIGDPSMKNLMEGVRRIASSPLPVLLLGETGTGKDVIARMLHLWGRTASGPFIPVNGALTGGSLAESELFGHRRGAFTGAEAPRLGALRSAHGGTLFLDEVADVPAPTQVKLLRSLENGEVKAMGSDCAERSDFRLVTATSRNLEKKIRDGEFRNDLYFRIAGHVIHVPPLRERPGDIAAITGKLALDRGLDVDEEALERLLHYQWPGNVRELKACIERAAVSAISSGVPRILPEHLAGLDSFIFSAGDGDDITPRTLAEIERGYLQAALLRHGWSRTIAARELGIARSTLWAKMKSYGLREPTGKRDFE